MTKIFYVLFDVLSSNVSVDLTTNGTSQLGLAPFEVLSIHMWLPYWACAELDLTCHLCVTNHTS